MRKTFMPSNDSDLLTFANNMVNYVSPDPEGYNLTAAESAELVTATSDFGSALLTLQDPLTRSPVNYERKRQAKAVLVAAIRSAVDVMQAWPQMTDVKRTELQITIPDRQPTPIGPPTAMPKVEVKSVIGRLINLVLKDAATGRRRKPAGVKSAWLFTYVGEEAPTDFGAYTFQGGTTKSSPHVVCPETVPAGSKVWVTAMWVNPTDVPGPACQPVAAWTNHEALGRMAA